MIYDEYMRASKKFPKFTSSHEGYAIILEELDELWEAIKSKDTNNLWTRGEASQVAAMALRYMVDCT
jgi:hypothetical protein